MTKQSPPPECPVARSLGEIGERWSLLILRDAFIGLTRFDEFQRNLACPTNILTARLKGLTDAGLFEKRRYLERPPRYEYVLTEKGRDFFPIIAALIGWGNRWLAPEGRALQLVSRKNNDTLEPLLIDEISGQEITDETATVAPGPAAGPQMLALAGSRR